MTTSPEDAAAMFDLPPEAAEATPDTDAAEALAAAEAELAAELACALQSGDFATDAPDSRAGRRVPVSWPARMRLADGRVIELRVRDLSEGGVGLASREPVPAATVVDFEMDVPPIAEGGAATAVKGTIRTTHSALRGAEHLCGATWVERRLPDVELVGRWIGRLRG